MTVMHSVVAPVYTGALVLGLTFTAWAGGGGKDDTRAAARPANLRVDTNLVLIPVSVTDAANHPIVGIDARQFRVFDGKSEQRVVSVSTDDTPLSVGIVFDASASMRSKLQQA